MYARVARWEGMDEEQIRKVAEEINASDGPPEGVPAKGITMLVDTQSGQSITVTLFETEDDLRTGDQTLNAMSPDAGFQGSRAGVEMYEVVVDRRL